ncbi:polymeric immunoglobulin receptor-like [Paramormyrops kingsleyae]|uniref:polymeric immunoglobulin receptor-like n=1 Tax=Paramormyrops kingsleyae TaxID=1676925 RepID=UPI003B975141
MDPLMLLFLLIAGLTGSDSVSSVGRVSVQSGGSVTIPCFYEDQYKTHVKYWCKGSDWSSCTTIVCSDSPQKKGEASIRDDPDQRVFNVTMNNLTDGDSGSYWCGVEIGRGSAVGTWVSLSVTEGSPGLSVDKQQVTSVEGDSVSIQCRYGDHYSLSWCRMGGSCITRSSGLDGRPVLIRDDRVKKAFIVTMRGLERKDTGWYWCDNGYQQIPVHISVSQRTTTTTSTELRSDSPQKKDEVSIKDDPDQSVFTVTMNNLKTGDSGCYWCGVEISRAVQEATGCTPASLMYSCRLWTPVELVFGSPPGPELPATPGLDYLQDHVQTMHELARKKGGLPKLDSHWRDPQEVLK